MTERWVIDTGPLSHFAAAGWLGILRMLAPGQTVWIPDTVEAEIRNGTPTRPWLGQILQHDWVHVQPVHTAEEIAAYSRYAQLLVGDDGRNSGECGVLALAEVHNFTAVLDDHAAHKAAGRSNVTARRTLGLLCDAVNSRLLTVETVAAVADALLSSDYRLPFPPGEFVRWARDNGRISTT